MARQRSTSRRRVLGTSGSIALLSLAGCLGDGDDEGPEADGDDDEEPEAGGNDDEEAENETEGENDDEATETDGDDGNATDEDSSDAGASLDVLVYDPDDQPVEGATVRVVNGETKEAETNEFGGASFTDLEQTEYTIEAEHDAGTASTTKNIQGLGNTASLTLSEDE